MFVCEKETIIILQQACFFLHVIYKRYAFSQSSGRLWKYHCTAVDIVESIIHPLLFDKSNKNVKIMTSKAMSQKNKRGARKSACVQFMVRSLLWDVLKIDRVYTQ